MVGIWDKKNMLGREMLLRETQGTWAKVTEENQEEQKRKICLK